MKKIFKKTIPIIIFIIMFLIYGIFVRGIVDAKLKQNIIGYTTHEWGEYPIFIKPGESYTISISVLVKVNGYKDDEIYEFCKHSKFTMSGHVFGIKFNLKTLKCN